MIKIENPEIDNIALEYCNGIKRSIIKRSQFLLDTLNVIFNANPHNILVVNRLKVNGKTRKKLINQFLFQNKLNNQNQYGNVVQNNCHNWVITSHNLLIQIATYLCNLSNIEQLLNCKPENLEQLDDRIKRTLTLGTNLTKPLTEFIASIIEYSLFDSYAFNIASKLNINTCPYCNRNYINTVIDKTNKRIIRPTFDHFFPQTHNPFLALSFYNLIPSCYYCNSSLKSATPTSIETHIHPYYEGYDSDATFNVVINRCKPAKSDPENYCLEFQDNMDSLSPNDKYRKIFGGTRSIPHNKEGNLNLFKLQDIYQSHLDIVGELIVKCDKLNSWYAGSLLSIFKLLGTNKSEFYQYYFGNYINEKDFNRRPMAKLTKDVVSQRLPKFVK